MLTMLQSCPSLRYSWVLMDAQLSSSCQKHVLRFGYVEMSIDLQHTTNLVAFHEQNDLCDMK